MSPYRGKGDWFSTRARSESHRSLPTLSPITEVNGGISRYIVVGSYTAPTR